MFRMRNKQCCAFVAFDAHAMFSYVSQTVHKMYVMRVSYAECTACEVTMRMFCMRVSNANVSHADNKHVAHAKHKL